MILDKNIEIKVHYKNKNYYNELGYLCEIGDIIIIDIKDLQNNYLSKINVSCDSCNKKLKIDYKVYYNSTNKLNDKFECGNCKRKNTSLERYGVDHPNKINKKIKNISALSSKEKFKKTSLERYGVDNPLKNKEVQKKRIETFKSNIDNINKNIKETNLKRYGVEYVFQAKEVKEKIKNTLLDKYGVTSPLKNKEIKNKQENTIIEKYGVNNVFKNEDIKDKIKEINLEKYNYEFYSQSDEYKNNLFEKHKNKIRERYNNLDIKEIYKNYTLDFYCNECKDYKNISINLLHQRHHYNVNICTVCNPLNNYTSKSENEIKEFIESLNIETKKDRNVLNGDEIDIYIPLYNLGFEHNGVYWHNEFNKPKDYHLNKTKLAKEKGVKLVHIWEDLWLNKQEIVKSRIKGLLNLNETMYARKCVIKTVNSSNSREFLNMNHLQGNANAAVKLGLYYNDELVSLMTFGSLRKNLGQKAIEGEFELLRFANKLNISVIGGASRLFKYFLDEYKPNRVISYADCDWTPNEQDNLYTKLGFKYLGHTDINYWWVVDGIRENRFKFRKDKLVKEGADPSMTEVEIMHDRGYYRCFGTGNYKFEWKKDSYF